MKRTITLFLGALAIVIGPLSLGQDAKETRISPTALRDALMKAAALRERSEKANDEGARDAIENEFRKLMIDSRSGFIEVTPIVGEGGPYRKIVLNPRRGVLDAIHFRMPTAGKTYRLHWSFVVPGRIDDLKIARIGIIDTIGEDLMFTRNDVLDDVKIPNSGVPETNQWIHYRLYGKKLEAAHEYILWFYEKIEQPLTIFSRVRIDPIEAPEPPRGESLKAERLKFQQALEKINERYDDGAKAARRKFLGEIDKAARAVSKKNANDRKALQAEADRANLGDSATSDPRGFRIIRAETGIGDQWNDVTPQVRAFVKDDRLTVRASEFDFKQDAAFGTAKTLIIVYSVDGKPGVYAAPSEQDVDLPRRASPGK